VHWTFSKFQTAGTFELEDSEFRNELSCMLSGSSHEPEYDKPAAPVIADELVMGSDISTTAYFCFRSLCVADCWRRWAAMPKSSEWSSRNQSSLKANSRPLVPSAAAHIHLVWCIIVLLMFQHWASSTSAARPSHQLVGKLTVASCTISLWFSVSNCLWFSFLDETTSTLVVATLPHTTVNFLASTRSNSLK